MFNSYAKKKIQRVPIGNHVQFSMEKNGLFADGFTWFNYDRKSAPSKTLGSKAWYQVLSPFWTIPIFETYSEHEYLNPIWIPVLIDFISTPWNTHSACLVTFVGPSTEAKTSGCRLLMKLLRKEGYMAWKLSDRSMACASNDGHKKWWVEGMISDD